MDTEEKKMLYQCLRIRLVEEKIIEKYPLDLIQSPVHLSIGQEAVAVGICQALAADDLVFGTYRSHAMFLAKGGCLRKMLAELYGKASGICKGKAGSMHLTDPSIGLMGSSAVVGTTIPNAVGAAFANKVLAKPQLAVAFFGDGAMEEGVFHESLNFAKIKNLSMLFICEDNDLAVHAPKNVRQAFHLEKLLESFSIPYMLIESGFSVKSVCQAVEHARAATISSSSPYFLHVKTYRYKEHVGIGEDFHCGYRDKAAFEQWAKHDPLLQSTPLLQQWRLEIAQELQAAFAEVETYADADPHDLLRDVYS